MAYEQRDNSGSMFKNDRRTNDKQADMTGSVMIEGKEYWINAWRKIDKNNNPWYSFSFKEKQARAPSQGESQGYSKSVSDDEIPF